MGAERCLYGTEAPYGFSDEQHSYDYTAIRGWVESLPVSAYDKERIFSGNFQALVAG